MSKIIDRITTTAERLYALRRAIETKEEIHKKELESMKLERDAIQTSLLADMNKNKLSSIKIQSGDTFSRGVRKGIAIISEPMALKWAMENNAVGIDKILVAQKLKDAMKIPSCFKQIETEFISVRKAKKDDTTQVSNFNNAQGASDNGL